MFNFLEIGSPYSIFAIVAFLFYHLCLFAYADDVLEKPRLPIYLRPLLAVLNLIVVVCAINLKFYPATTYFVMLLILFLEFLLLYKDNLSKICFMVSNIMLHVMSIRAMCVAIFAFAINAPIYMVVHLKECLILSSAVAFTTLSVLTVALKFLVPGKRIKLISRGNHQFWFLTAWCMICIVYLLYNARVYSTFEAFTPLIGLQITTSAAILATLYIVIIFSIRTTELMDYKDKNSVLQLAIQKEYLYRKSIVSDAISTYEFNLTKDQIVLGFIDSVNGEADQNQKPRIVYNYTSVMEDITRLFVHAEDAAAFAHCCNRKNLMEAFTAGKSEVIIEYRRMVPESSFIWVREVITLIKDLDTGDITGFVYVKDIDEEKKSQLELQFKAERDALTGLYNKEMTGKLITRYLQSSKAGGETGALLIIDVDNFKTVNDSLGHTFGDAVLCALGEKLRSIFRDNDIIGRIGGDEFMAFMSNTKSTDIAKEKAAQICTNFKTTYEGTGGKKITISGSVGIAFFPNHGLTFEELYKNADVALYATKNKGKDNFSVFEGQDFTEYISNRTKIESQKGAEQKSFLDNKLEYVFKILYDSPQPMGAIQSILELLSDHYGFSRGYIFELSQENHTLCNTFEWAEQGINPSCIATGEPLPISAFREAYISFEDSGVYALSRAEAGPDMKAFMKSRGAKSMLLVAMMDVGRITGFIGFDDCITTHIFAKGDVKDIAAVCQVLAVFIAKERKEA